MYYIVPSHAYRTTFFREALTMPNLPLESFVNNLIEKFNISYPIFSIHTLISNLGGSIITAEDSTQYKDGVIRKFGNGFQMYLPYGMSEDFERYTIARLLGYLFLGMGYKINVNKWQSSEMYPPSKPLSKEAQERLDYFAHAFLMPRKLFQEKLQQYENDDMEREINLMVKFFRVPRERVIARSVQLDILDAE